MSMQTEVHAKRTSGREREGASDQSHGRGDFFYDWVKLKSIQRRRPPARCERNSRVKLTVAL
jgi:hypothetical protein